MPQSLGPTARRAIAEAAELYELDPDELMERDKRRELVQARLHVMIRLREQGWSLTRIARVFGQDHTSVLYHLRKAQKETDNG
jgi:chromosomal replication initiation ATPase DnaA